MSIIWIIPGVNSEEIGEIISTVMTRVVGFGEIAICLPHYGPSGFGKVVETEKNEDSPHTFPALTLMFATQPGKKQKSKVWFLLVYSILLAPIFQT